MKGGKEEGEGVCKQSSSFSPEKDNVTLHHDVTFITSCLDAFGFHLWQGAGYIFSQICALLIHREVLCIKHAPNRPLASPCELSRTRVS